jgi:hypothetical protein
MTEERIYHIGACRHIRIPYIASGVHLVYEGGNKVVSEGRTSSKVRIWFASAFKVRRHGAHSTKSTGRIVGLALILAIAVSSTASAEPAPLTNDVGAGTSASISFPDQGFALLNERYATGTPYALRLVQSTGVEQFRNELEAAAWEVWTASGISISVLPGTVPNTGQEPGVGEILFSVDFPPCGSGGGAGCAEPKNVQTRPSDFKEVVRSGRIWINISVLSYTQAQQDHVIKHELGHALGLAHYTASYQGQVQVMSNQSYDASTYRSGDRNGLSHLALPQVDYPRVAFTDGVRDKITDWAFNPYVGWQQTQRAGSSTTPGTSPSAVMASHRPHIFFVDATNGNTITDWTFSTNGWQQMPLGGHSVAPGTSPTALVVEGKPRVYYVDANNNNTITEWAWTGSTWQQTPLWGHPVASGTRPAVTLVDGKPRVYYVDAGNNNTITEWAWTSNGWQQTPLWGHRVSPGTSPTAFTYNGAPHVVYVDEGNNNTLTNWRWTSSGWNQVPLWGHRVAAESSPTSVVSIAGGHPTVFFADQANNNSMSFWILHPTAGWIQGFLYGHPIAPGTSPSADISNGVEHVYFADASAGNTLVDFNWNSVTGWQQTFMYGQSLEAGTSPSGF